MTHGVGNLEFNNVITHTKAVVGNILTLVRARAFDHGLPELGRKMNGTASERSPDALVRPTLL